MYKSFLVILVVFNCLIYHSLTLPCSTENSIISMGKCMTLKEYRDLGKHGYNLRRTASNPSDREPIILIPGQFTNSS